MYILANAHSNQKYAGLRHANLDKIDHEPVIGGEPVLSGGRSNRVLDKMTPELLDEIEPHVKVGNVRLCDSLGHDLDPAELREKLWPTKKKAPKKKAAAPKAEKAAPKAEKAAPKKKTAAQKKTAAKAEAE